MLFFNSRYGVNYAYHALSNKIVKIPEKYLSLSNNELYPIIENAINKKNSSIIFSRPENEWLKSENNKIESMVLNVTDACNLRCSYCAYSGSYPFERAHGNSIMSIDIAKSAIDFFIEKNKNNNNSRRVSFYGGEPLLAKNTINFAVSYIKENSPKTTIAISTNGDLINESWIDFFVKNEIQLNISLDGNQADHDRYRLTVNGKKTHSNLIKNLSEIKKFNANYYEKNIVFIATLVPPYQLLSLYNFYKNTSLVNSQPWYINYIKPLDTKFFQDYAPDTDRNLREHQIQLRLIIDDYIDELIKGQNADTHFGYWIFGEGLRKIHTRTMNPSPFVWINGSCTPGVSRVFVDTTGKFYPCERSGDFMCIGNTHTGFDGANAELIVNAYHEDCSKNCQSCPNVRFCDTCYLGARKGNDLEVSQKYLFCDKRIDKLKTCLYIYTSALEKNPNAFNF